MSKDETYYFHQTPEELCKKLIEQVPLVEGDRVLEAFRGEGNFYNNLPDFVEKDWAEITEGRDYKDHTKPFDWIITNPPFRMDEEQTGRRENTFYKLLKYYTQINTARKVYETAKADVSKLLSYESKLKDQQNKILLAGKELGIDVTGSQFYKSITAALSRFDNIKTELKDAESLYKKSGL